MFLLKFNIFDKSLVITQSSWTVKIIPETVGVGFNPSYK